MALLNPPEILPPLIRSVVEVVAASDRPVDDARLIEALSPGEDGEDGSIGRSTKPHVRFSHRAARTLGFLGGEVGGSVPTELTLNALDRGSLRIAWPQLLRRVIFEHESAPEAVTEAAEQNSRGVRDLLFALTWFLAQDALGAPLRWEPHKRYAHLLDLQQSDFGRVTRRFPVQNDTRFAAFERWSLHLGLAQGDELGQKALRPVPLPAARDVVGVMRPGRYEVTRFCSAMSEYLPCLWPGALRKQLVKIVGRDPDPDVSSAGIDSSVTMVLVALEAEGRLRIDNLADASERAILAPRSQQPRAVTHVEVLV